MGKYTQYQPPHTISAKILSLVSDISALIAKYEVLEPKIITPALRKEFKIKTIVGTLEIEGNTLGKERVTAILDGKRVLGSVKEIAEVKGAIKVYENLQQFNPFNLDEILKAHYVLMQEIMTDAGKFRTKAVGVGGPGGLVHIAPPANKVPALVQDLFDWLKATDAHPLIKSCVFHYELEFIHPFTDGNGRIGRLWQTLILHAYKPVFSSLPVESVIKEYQQQYYDALEQSGSLGESTPFIEFMLEILLKSIDNSIHTDHVTDQVRKLLSVMEKQWLSRSEIMKKLGLSHRPTFRENYLNPALEQGLIEMLSPETPRSPKQKYRFKETDHK